MMQCIDVPVVLIVMGLGLVSGLAQLRVSSALETHICPPKFADSGQQQYLWCVEVYDMQVPAIMGLSVVRLIITYRSGFPTAVATAWDSSFRRLLLLTRLPCTAWPRGRWLQCSQHKGHGKHRWRTHCTTSLHGVKSTEEQHRIARIPTVREHVESWHDTRSVLNFNYWYKRYVVTVSWRFLSCHCVARTHPRITHHKPCLRARFLALSLRSRKGFDKMQLSRQVTCNRQCRNLVPARSTR